MTWEFAQEALAASDEIYYEKLTPISFEAFTDGILRPAGADPLIASRNGRETYADLLLDLTRLVEEVRFQIALATLLPVDWRVTRDRGAVEPLPQVPFGAVIPNQIMAALANYVRLPPPPSQLLSTPHQIVSANRHLSRWTAAQSLDSAMLRLLAALDRIAGLLFIRTGKEIPKKKDGTLRLPGFNRDTMMELRGAFAHHQDWPAFRQLLQHPIFKVAKRYRDGTIHHRRWPSELHGESELAYWDAGSANAATREPEERHEGLSAQDHLGLLLAAWDLVLQPTALLGGSLMRSGLSGD